jgi:hypothetical protein
VYARIFRRAHNLKPLGRGEGSFLLAIEVAPRPLEFIRVFILTTVSGLLLQFLVDSSCPRSGYSDNFSIVRYISWHLMVSAGLGAGALLTEGIGNQLISLPLIKQADNMEVWFAGRAEFDSEHMRTGVAPVRTARWETLRAGHCSIKDAQVTIKRDGGVKFSGKVKSKDDHDHYCVIIEFFDRRQLRLWHSSKLCTQFELSDEYLDWTDTTISFPVTHYQFIAFATRKDYC